MAFGATSVLDNFNRTAEDPLSSGGSWTSQIRSGDENLQTNGTQCYVNDNPSQQASAWWNVETFGADSEAYVTIATKPTFESGGRASILLRLASPGTSVCDGYLAIMRDTGVTTQGLYRYDNDSATLLGADLTPTWTAGDKLGIEAIGSTIKMYQYTSGAWSELASRSDSTYSAAGYIGIDTGVNDTRLDDFGGGNLSTESASISPSVSPSASLSPSASESPTVSGSASVSPSVSGSASISPSISGSPSVSESASVSPSVSASASVSPSISGSPSESLSISGSASESLSVSPSASVSPSVSGSASESPSVSGSASVSPSISGSPSVSLSISLSASVSPSISGSPSESPSISGSPSVSPSISGSPSESPSISPSASESPTISASASVSPSISGSASESLSVSPSPSVSLSISGSASESPSISGSASESPSVSLSASVSFSVSGSASVSLSISLSASVSPSISGSPSESPSISGSASVSLSVSESPSVSLSISPSASASPSMPTGDVCWGHVTGVLEDNIRTFSGNWTGTGAISGVGDAEVMCLDEGETMTSEVVDTGAVLVTLLQNVYAAGDTVVLSYRHGATEGDCLAAAWNDYVNPFVSLGYVQVMVEYS